MLATNTKILTKYLCFGWWLFKNLTWGEERHFSLSIICKSISKSHHDLKYKKKTTYQNNLEKLFPSCKIFKSFRRAPGSCSSWWYFNVTEQEWNDIMPLEVHTLYQTYTTALKPIQSSILQSPLLLSFFCGCKRKSLSR